MLGKLFKHEFKSTGRIMGIVFAVDAALIALMFITALLKIEYLKVTVVLFMVMACFATIVMVYLTTAMEFWKTMYGRQGALTNTLPVKPGSLLLSKITVAAAWLSVSVLAVILMAAAIATCVTEKINLLWIDDLIGLLDIAPKGSEIAAIFLILVLILQAINLILLIYFVSTLANMKPFQSMGIGAAVLLFFGFSFAVNIIDSIASTTIPLSIALGSEGFKIISKNLLTAIMGGTLETIPILPIGSLIVNIVLTVLYYMLTQKFINKKICVK